MFLYFLRIFCFCVCFYRYLATAFYGLIELNYYVYNNCGDGYTCQTEIYPGYAWICLTLCVFLMSCCTYLSIRNIDPPLIQNTVKYYLPEHEDAAESQTPPIKLQYVLEAQEAARSVLVYSLVTYFMQNSALLLTGFTSTESAGLNIIGILQPVGWSNIKQHPSFDEDAAKGLINAGQTLGSISMIIWSMSLVIWVGLLFGVRRFQCGLVFKSCFVVTCACFILLWIYGCLFFYYKAFHYWRTENGKQYVYTVQPSDTNEDIKSKFLYVNYMSVICICLFGCVFVWCFFCM